MASFYVAVKTSTGHVLVETQTPIKCRAALDKFVEQLQAANPTRVLLSLVALSSRPSKLPPIPKTLPT